MQSLCVCRKMGPSSRPPLPRPSVGGTLWSRRSEALRVEPSLATAAGEAPTPLGLR